MLTIMLIMMFVIIGAIMISLAGALISCLPVILVFFALVCADILVVRAFIKSIKKKKK